MRSDNRGAPNTNYIHPADRGVILTRRMIPMVCALAILATLPDVADAQGLEYFRSPDARITSAFMAEPGLLGEVVGLDSWTLERMQEAAKARGMYSLFTSEGVTVLLSEFGFPQAHLMRATRDSAVTIFLAVIEPDDSSLVVVRDMGDDTTRSIAPWSSLVELARTRFSVIEEGMLANIHARAVGLRPRLSMSDRADSVDLTEVWHTLHSHRTPEDLDAARRILTTSPNVYDRIAAVTILSNFDREGAAWHALVGALLDPKDAVREHAATVLRVFTSDLTRRVDWRPAATELHAILQGSDLFFLGEVLDMLVATGVGPEIASPLLRNGGHAVLMFAGAKNPLVREPAHRFLLAVSGRRVTTTPEEWRAWIDTLYIAGSPSVFDREDNRRGFSDAGSG